MIRTLRAGARGSRLSLWQAHHAIEQLQRRGVPVDLVVLSSSGDRDRDVAIEDLPSTAPFADDLEDALEAGAIDVAVHSLKDLALVPRAGLVVSALLPRGPVTESLVSRNHVRFAALPPGVGDRHVFVETASAGSSCGGRIWCAGRSAGPLTIASSKSGPEDLTPRYSRRQDSSAWACRTRSPKHLRRATSCRRQGRARWRCKCANPTRTRAR